MPALPFLEYLRRLKTLAQDAELTVLGNQAADLDSLASTLVFAWYLSRQHPHKTVIPLIAIPHQEMKLRPEAAFVFAEAGINPDDLLFSDDVVIDHLLRDGTDLVLVDHNSLETASPFAGQKVSAIIDHHHDQGTSPNATPRIIAEVGSCATLIAELVFQDNAVVERPVALLLLSAILMDTVNLNDSAGRCTDRDKEMVNKLLSISAVERKTFFNDLHQAQHDLAKLSSQELLARDYKEWPSPVGSYGMSTVLVSLRDWQEREPEFDTAISQYVSRKNVHVLLIMLASYQPDFRRELILFSRDKRLYEKIAVFLAGQGLLLSAVRHDAMMGDGGGFMSVYRQGNVFISRKKLQPLVHAFLASGLP